MKHKMTGFRILLCLLAVFVALSFAAPSAYAEETPVPDGSSQEGTMPPADPAGEPAGEPTGEIPVGDIAGGDGAVGASLDYGASAAANTVSAYATVSGNTVTISGDVTVTSNGDALIFTGADNLSTTYTVTDGAALTINGDGDLTLGDISATLLSSLVINISEITVNGAVDLGNAAVTINTQWLNLTGAGRESSTFKAGSLSVNMSHDGTFSGAELVISKVAAKRLTANISNCAIVLSGDFILDADVKESRLADETSEIPWGDMPELEVLDGSKKYCANVRPIYINATISGAKIAAANITVDANTDILMNTVSHTVPVAASVAVLSSKINVVGSELNATAGNLSLGATNKVVSTVKAEAAESLTFALAVGVVKQTTKVVVDANSNLSASGNIAVNAKSDIDAHVDAYGIENSQDKSGVYSTVTVVNQDTLAEVGGSANAGLDIDVNAEEDTNAYTKATSGAAEEPKEGEGTEEGKDGEKLTVADILKFLAGMTVEDEAGNQAKAVSDDDTAVVSDSLDKAAESATEEKEDKLEEDTTAPAENTDAQTVKITVKDGDKLVEGVTIVLSKDGTEVKTEATGEDGVATFNNVEAGAYAVRLTLGIPEGYKTPEKLTFTLEEGKSYAGTYTLQKNTSSSQLVGSLGVGVGNTSSNAVVDSNGTVIAGGKLNIVVNSNILFQTIADASAKDDIEKIAAKVICQYKVQYVPERCMCYTVDVNVLAEMLGLKIEYVNITRDGSILGQTSSGRVWTEIYDDNMNKLFIELDGSTILVDKRLLSSAKIAGRKNFTITLL